VRPLRFAVLECVTVATLDDNGREIMQ